MPRPWLLGGPQSWRPSAKTNSSSGWLAPWHGGGRRGVAVAGWKVELRDVRRSCLMARAPLGIRFGPNRRGTLRASQDPISWVMTLSHTKAPTYQLYAPRCLLAPTTRTPTMAAVCTAEAKAGERAEATVTDYALAATVLAEADYILFAGGAGLSAECGLKTFANAGTFADGLSYDQVRDAP